MIWFDYVSRAIKWNKDMMTTNVWCHTDAIDLDARLQSPRVKTLSAEGWGSFYGQISPYSCWSLLKITFIKFFGKCLEKALSCLNIKMTPLHKVRSINRWSFQFGLEELHQTHLWLPWMPSPITQRQCWALLMLIWWQIPAATVQILSGWLPTRVEAVIAAHKHQG